MIEGCSRRVRLRQFLIAIIVLTAGTYAAAMVRLMTQETELIFRTDSPGPTRSPSFPVRTDRCAASRRRAPVRLAHRTRQAAGPRLTRPTDLGAVSARQRLDRREPHERQALHAAARAWAECARARVSRLQRPGGTSRRKQESPPMRGRRTTTCAIARASPAERLVIFGWSLGAAVAVELASTVDARGVVLEGAPASIADIGQEQYPFFPVRWIIRNPFNAIESRRRAFARRSSSCTAPKTRSCPFKRGPPAVRCGALAQDLRRGAGRPHRSRAKSTARSSTARSGRSCRLLPRRRSLADERAERSRRVTEQLASAARWPRATP